MKRKSGLGLMAGVVAACVVNGVMAENVFLPDTQPKEWKAECTSCHVGFPPQLMRSLDWKNLMAQLDKHFGTDASVGAKDNAAILAWLTQNGMAEDNKLRTSPDLRVTTTPFFQREHYGFIPEGFKHPAVKTAANCEACHADPEVGHYSHTTHVPEGIVQKPRPPRPAGASGPPPGEGPPAPRPAS